MGLYSITAANDAGVIITFTIVEAPDKLVGAFDTSHVEVGNRYGNARIDARNAFGVPESSRTHETIAECRCMCGVQCFAFD